MRAIPAGDAVLYSSGNRLLDALPRSDAANLADELTIVSLRAHQSTNSMGRTMSHVDFPIDAVLSIVATLKNGESVEVGTVGSESFVESEATLGYPLSTRSSFCQVQGRVGRMSIACFERRMATSPVFAQSMRRNVQAVLFSAQQFMVCNLKHSVLQRCARWLAMTADRVGSPEFTLTQEFLAIMLGAQAAVVSQAAGTLEDMGALTYSNGVVKVLDADMLERMACECYDASKAAFAASLSP